MCFHRSSASEQRIWRVSSLEAALRGGGMREDGMLLTYIQNKRSGVRWRRSTPLSLHVSGAGEHIMSAIRRIPFVRTPGRSAARRWQERGPPAFPLVGRELPVRGGPAFQLHTAAELVDPKRFGDVERGRASLRLPSHLGVASRLIRREVGWRLGWMDPPGGGTAVEGHRQPNTATNLPPDVAPDRHRRCSSAARRWGLRRDTLPVTRDPVLRPSLDVTIDPCHTRRKREGKQSHMYRHYE